jgi:hypothetical protein
MAQVDEATIQTLKNKYKKLLLVTDRDGDEYVCRLPTLAEVERLRQAAGKDDTKIEASRGLVMSTVVWPDQETLASLLDEYPLLAATLENKIAEFGKLEQNAKAKKL